MTSKNFLFTASVFLITCVASSCVNLNQINDYSSKSSVGIKKFEDINYSFNQHCIDRCKFEAVRRFEIKREVECNCNIYKAADSVTLLIYNSIRGYFDGLTNLSNNDLTKYDFDALTKALTEGDFGSIKVEEAEVKAYSNISKILIRATTDLYRKKKLKAYIDSANTPIQILIQKFQFILQKNLVGELNFKKEKLFAYYKEMNLNGNVSDYEQGKATIDYYQQLSDVSQKQKQIETFAKGLKSIADGHQELYDNRNQLTIKAIKESIKHYASNIQDIISEFNKLKSNQ